MSTPKDIDIQTMVLIEPRSGLWICSKCYGYFRYIKQKKLFLA
jgi:hypothetical protein